MGPAKKSTSSEEPSISSDESEEVVQRDQPTALLPNIYSPKLFLVRVPPGKEFAFFERISSLKNVLSVIYKEELKGYLYVEASNKRSLQESLKSRHVSLIPQNEMTDVFFSPPINSKYGRIKSGKYKGDTCEILFHVNPEIVLVKLIPRLDGVKKLFDPQGLPTVKSQGYLIYKKDSYKNGFLEKEVLVRNIIPISKISLEEMALFEPKRLLRNSEKVKVVRGEFKNEEGIILRAEVDGALVDLRNFGRQFLDYDSLLEIKEAKLDFSVFKKEERKNETEKTKRRRDPLVNKEVTVKKGEFKGYKGIITSTYRDKVRVLINTNNKDINVLREDVLVEEETEPRIIPKAFTESGFRTPGVEFKTPSYKTPGYKTPGYKTPGFRTPGMEYRTPLRTPGLDFKNTPGMEYKTPSYKTPGTEKTPSYRTPLEKKTFAQTGLFKGVLIYADGKIKEITDSTNEEYICEEKTYKKHLVKFVCPEKYDTICFMEGENKGKHGLLVAINGEECVVRLEDKPINCKMYEISRVGG